MKKVIRWPANFFRHGPGAYFMADTVYGCAVAVSVDRHVYGRWEFVVRVVVDGAPSRLQGYTHTMAAAKRCAHRDMMFLLKRAGVKGVF